MNNGDMPAIPCDDIVRRDDNGNLYGAPISSGGLTKREHFAAMAMQGLLVNMGRNEFNDSGAVSSEAVKQADALLKELEK